MLNAFYLKDCITRSLQGGGLQEGALGKPFTAFTTIHSGMTLSVNDYNGNREKGGI